MPNIPVEIDGARIILYSVKSYPLDFGYVIDESGNNIPIKILVIAQYKDDADFYVFDCDENWRVWGDTVHESLEEAKIVAKDSSPQAEHIDWQKP